MENEKEVFQYTYSAVQQEEIKRIRRKYIEVEEDKLAQLRRLDKSATQKGTMVSLILGVSGTLLLGIGMCCALVWSENLFVVGIVVGLIGIAVLSAAYPVYQRITKKEREKIAPEILRLTEELMRE